MNRFTRLESPSIHHFALFAEWCNDPALVAMIVFSTVCVESPGPSFKLTCVAETGIPGKIVDIMGVRLKELQSISFFLPCQHNCLRISQNWQISRMYRLYSIRYRFFKLKPPNTAVDKTLKISSMIPPTSKQYSTPWKVSRQCITLKQNWGQPMKL